jgi:hypothetical protein
LETPEGVGSFAFTRFEWATCPNIHTIAHYPASTCPFRQIFDGG